MVLRMQGRYQADRSLTGILPRCGIVTPTLLTMDAKVCWVNPVRGKQSIYLATRAPEFQRDLPDHSLMLLHEGGQLLVLRIGRLC